MEFAAFTQDGPVSGHGDQLDADTLHQLGDAHPFQRSDVQPWDHVAVPFVVSRHSYVVVQVHHIERNALSMRGIHRDHGAAFIGPVGVVRVLFRGVLVLIDVAGHRLCGEVAHEAVVREAAVHGGRRALYKGLYGR